MKVLRGAAPVVAVEVLCSASRVDLVVVMLLGTPPVLLLRRSVVPLLLLL